MKRGNTVRHQKATAKFIEKHFRSNLVSDGMGGAVAIKVNTKGEDITDLMYPHVSCFGLVEGRTFYFEEPLPDDDIYINGSKFAISYADELIRAVWSQLNPHPHHIVLPLLQTSAADATKWHRSNCGGGIQLFSCKQALFVGYERRIDWMKAKLKWS